MPNVESDLGTEVSEDFTSFHCWSLSSVWTESAIMASLSPPPRTYDASTLTKLIHGQVVEVQPKSYFSPPSSYRQTTTALSSSQKERSTIHVHFNEPESSRSSRRSTRTEGELDDSNQFPSLFDDKHLSIASTVSSSHSFMAEKKVYEPPHHVFSPRKKKCIVLLVSYAAMFSSLSSNIYFPALGQVSKVFPLSELSS